MRFSSFVFTVSVLGVVALMLQGPPAYADFYKWVDKNGTVWLTDDPNALPEGSGGQFEKVMTTEETPEAVPQNGGVRRSELEPERTSSAESYREKEASLRDERSQLEEEISTIEANLSAARRALKRVPLTDRRGYWYVIDPATGSKVPATYKDPGAIWSNATWPALPRSARTMESEERRRIQSDMARFEKDLNRAKEELFRLSRRP